MVFIRATPNTDSEHEYFGVGLPKIESCHLIAWNDNSEKSIAIDGSIDF